jgi:lysozyme family protein
MMDNFAPSLAHVLRSEGGFVNDPKDPGGATEEGVTQHQYDLWRIAHKQPTRSVRFIDPNEVEAIYRRWYWDAVRADKLPHGVDYCVFDCAVNSGPHRAAEWLQLAAAVRADGQIGDVTISAVNAADPRRIIHGICTQRLAFLETLPTWPHFKNGWSARVAGIEQDARGMA